MDKTHLPQHHIPRPILQQTTVSRDGRKQRLPGALPHRRSGVNTQFPQFPVQAHPSWIEGRHQRVQTRVQLNIVDGALRCGLFFVDQVGLTALVLLQVTLQVGAVLIQEVWQVPLWEKIKY